MAENSGGTHAQRRTAQRVKTMWIDRIVNGSHTLADLIAASQDGTKDGQYVASILLVDLLSSVHPGLSRPQVLTHLETLDIKLPADPARFSVRSIRLRADVVEQVDAMLRSSVMTASGRARHEVPTNWPWGVKLTTLVRLNGADVPPALEWLEAGGRGDFDLGDLMLSGDGPSGAPFGALDEIDDGGVGTDSDTSPSGEVDAPAVAPDSGSLDQASADDADDDPVAFLESELGIKLDVEVVQPSSDEPTDDDVLAQAFGDVALSGGE